MAVLTVNNIAYSYPAPGDQNWGTNASDWAAAITAGMLQKAGGAFTLTAEVDFGASFGVKSLYYKTRTSNGASAGQVRLARADVISWRNEANSADLDLGVNSSNQLTFGGTALGGVSAVSDSVTVDLMIVGSTLSASVQLLGLTDAYVSASAAITRSKLAAGSAHRLVVNNASGVMTDAAAITAGRALISDSNGIPASGGVTDGELAHLSGIGSNVQTQLNARLPLAGGTMTGAITLSGAPTAALHAVTMQYVQDVLTGVTNRLSVRVATIMNGTYSSAFEDGDTVDGVVLAEGDRILLKNQNAVNLNGIYVVLANGIPDRAEDADSTDDLAGATVFVEEGTANAGTTWACTIPSDAEFGADDITFVQIGAGGATYSADGSGIELSGSTFSIELDGTTLSKSASGLKVAALGIANAQVSASAAIDRSKIAVGTANRLVYNLTGTGALADLGAITASRVLVSDASGLPSAASTTTTTLAFLDATSSVQTQLDAKMPKSGGTFTGGVSGTTLALSGAMTGASSDVSGEAECGTLDCIGNAAVGGSLTVTGTLTVDGEEIGGGDSAVYQSAITAEVSGAAASTIDITGIPAFDYYEIVLDVIVSNASGTEGINVYFNNDTSSNYRTYTSSSLSAAILCTQALQGTSEFFGRWLVSNHATRVKALTPLGAAAVRNTGGVVAVISPGGSPTNVYALDPSQNTSLAGTFAVDRAVSVWANTSDQISRMTFGMANGAEFQIGSRIKIIGFNF